MRSLGYVAPLAIVLIAGLAFGTPSSRIFAEEPKAESTADTAPEAKADAKADAKSAGGDATAKMTPYELVKATEQGKLKNPFQSTPETIAEGKKLYLGNSCNGCHGGTGGGGMCPPLTNETWIYGSDDDTLFRLITMGSKELQESGITRKRQEAVKGPMPDYKEIIKDQDQLWKIIIYIRSVYRGRAEKIDW